MRGSTKAIALNLLLLLLAFASGATEIVYLDLAQEGSATVVFQGTPENPKVIVVDTGKASNDVARGGAKLRSFLEKRGVDTIDLLVLTHLDADHAQGYGNLLGLHEVWSRDPAGRRTQTTRGPPLQIRQAVAPAWQPGWEKAFARRLQDELRSRKIPLHLEPDPDLESRLQRLGVRVLFPKNELVRGSNDSSLVVTVTDTTAGHLHVITGDTTPKMWDAVYSSQITGRVLTLTAPHHGGEVQQLERMVRQLRPEVIVVSANQENQYEHPLPEAVARAWLLGPPVLVTGAVRGVTYQSGVTLGERISVIQGEPKNLQAAGANLVEERRIQRMPRLGADALRPGPPRMFHRRAPTAPFRSYPHENLHRATSYWLIDRLGINPARLEAQKKALADEVLWVRRAVEDPRLMDSIRGPFDSLSPFDLAVDTAVEREVQRLLLALEVGLPRDAIIESVHGSGEAVTAAELRRAMGLGLDRSDLALIFRLLDTPNATHDGVRTVRLEGLAHPLLVSETRWRSIARSHVAHQVSDRLGSEWKSMPRTRPVRPRIRIR